jgi:hypothetical protein
MSNIDCAKLVEEARKNSGFASQVDVSNIPSASITQNAAIETPKPMPMPIESHSNDSAHHPQICVQLPLSIPQKTYLCRN